MTKMRILVLRSLRIAVSFGASGIAAAVTAVFVSSCGNPVVLSSQPGQFAITSAARSCAVKTFHQPTELQTHSIDLLFVSSTQPSMDRYRCPVADAVGDFVSRLPAGIDYRAAVMLGHGSTSNYSGRLYSTKNHPKVLDSNLLSLGEIRADLQDSLLNVPRDPLSHGGEEVMYSLSRSLDSDRLAESKSEGFFRDSAALSVILITNENDMCFQPSYQGMTHWPDLGDSPDASARAAYQRDCVTSGSWSLTPEALLEKIRSHQARRPTALGGLIFDNPLTITRGQENSIGHGILELVQSGGGYLMDLAVPDLTPSLQQLDGLVEGRLNIQTQFNLADTGIIPGTIRVTVDSVPVATSVYDPLQDSVSIPPDLAGSAGSVVQINYCTGAGSLDAASANTQRNRPHL